MPFKGWKLGAVVLSAAVWLGCNTSRPDPAATASPKTVMEVSLRHFDQEKEVTYPWGRIRWMMNSSLDHGAAQTFGVVQINPGQKNFLHAHPNCEEILYVLSGSCEHIVGDKKVTLHPKDLLRVPQGVPHQAIVIGNEPLVAIISYSSPDRQVINYGDRKE